MTTDIDAASPGELSERGAQLAWRYLAGRLRRPHRFINPYERQIKAWRKANAKMGWGIQKEEFERLQAPPAIEESDRQQGYVGAALFYGFGDDGAGNADPVLSGKAAWEYAAKSLWRETWQCEYLDFNRSDDMRLRPGAPPRPKGFYYAELQLREKVLPLTVSQFRKQLKDETGWGPEGVQFLAVTHRHFQDLMNAGKVPFIALADYEVAPYGFNDFFDAAQMFCSNHVLGLGIGNVDQNYPLFSIPALRLSKQGRLCN